MSSNRFSRQFLVSHQPTGHLIIIDLFVQQEAQIILESMRVIVRQVVTVSTSAEKLLIGDPAAFIKVTAHSLFSY